MWTLDKVCRNKITETCFHQKKCKKACRQYRKLGYHKYGKESIRHKISKYMSNAGWQYVESLFSISKYIEKITFSKIL